MLEFNSLQWCFRFAVGFTAVVLLVTVAGCGPDVVALEKEGWTDETMVQAREEYLQGDTDEAIRLYQQVLRAKPDLAVAHLAVGLLLHSYQSDYVRAIYHYTRYLELSPGSEKTGMVQGRIRTAAQQFAVSIGVPDNPARTGDSAKLEKENLALRMNLKNTEARLTKAKEQIRQLQAALGSAQTQRGGEAPTTGTASGGSGSASVPASTPSMRTYEVMRGDTLSKIALKVYKDPGKWRKIFDANQDVLKGSEQVKPGQVLVIP